MASESSSNSIGSLGEFGLIEHITKNIKLKNSSSIVGVGDDAAVIDNSGLLTIITTDLLTEGIHFNLIYTPLKHLGYKAAAVNLSDIFAMNAIPKQLLVSIALSSKFTVSMIDELYEGIYMACERYGVDVVGGDTSSSMTGLTLSLTAVGEAKKEDILYRNGAGINDLICVSGNLGASFMGLQLLERERQIFEKTGRQPDLEGYDYLLERQLKPEPRGDVIQLLKEQGIKPTSMIDISDGLSSELHHICKRSDKGCKIFAGKIPVDPDTKKLAEEMNMSEFTAALNGGEDYELLFTVKLSDFDKIKNNPAISVIGHITDKSEGLYLSMADGSLTELRAQGWNSLG